MGVGATGASRNCAGEKVQGTSLSELEVGWEGSRLRSWERRASWRRAQCPIENAVLLRVQTGHSPSLSRWQHLQEDRDDLHTTAELLQVRVQSLTHILSMQEEELARKVGPCPGPLWVGGVGVLPDPAEILPPPPLPAPNTSFCCVSCCLGRTEKNQDATPFLCSPKSPHCHAFLLSAGSAFRFPGA